MLDSRWIHWKFIINWLVFGLILGCTYFSEPPGSSRQEPTSCYAIVQSLILNSCAAWLQDLYQSLSFYHVSSLKWIPHQSLTLLLCLLHCTCHYRATSHNHAICSIFYRTVSRVKTLHRMHCPSLRSHFYQSFKVYLVSKWEHKPSIINSHEWLFFLVSLA